MAGIGALFNKTNMAEFGYMRNTDWKDDEELKETISCLVLRNFTRKEILDFLMRDFPQYAWSLGSLSRRMKHFDIKYVDYSTTVE